ncbi:two-component system, sensor histidine kinase YesM [Oribacterium sp. KHPX15]|uniref:sensor histidine kinase n=1 Tax=Oribacterium sp. KHPX15 TaxID=1855342 RepID=UPI0008977C4A|nr:sensor histidine kinase [Oribacterium sp. KHPX15]SDZ79165.1 two-component system, sensor histidine kinase YesM [Oribacterium sp. KHPX15]
MGLGFIKQSFKRQIFAVFLLVLLLIVIPGGILTIQTFQTRVRIDYENRDLEQQRFVSDRISGMLELSKTAMENLSRSRVIKEALRTGSSNTIDVYSELYRGTEDIRNFAVIELYRGSKCRYSTGTSNGSLMSSDYYWMLKEAEAGKDVVAYALNSSAVDAGSSLLMVKKVLDDPEPCFIMIRLSQDQVKEQIKDGINARDGFILANKYLRPFCLIGTAEDGMVLSKVRENLLSSRAYNSEIRDNVYLNELSGTELLCLYITPPVLEESAVNAGYRVLLLLVLFGMIVCFIAASKFSEFFSRPINELYRAMKRFRKGDFDTKIELDREDEFQQLAVGFNKMTTQLKETMEEQVRAERKVTETRIAMMQAQLNPHFLYNTLDTIKWAAKANQVSEVATLASSLAGILRYSISGKQFSPLEKELEMIRRYCDIQRIRFDDCFTLETEVSEELLNAVVPKLILQPLVENSIIHGMEGQKDGRIKVRAFAEENLQIDIEDNGKGISDEYIKALETDDEETLKGHLGLNNVNTIIRMYYGKEYGVKASRREEGGTLITVRVPLEFGEINE